MLLAVELLDELLYGSREAAWPLIRHDLGLGYAAVGLLLALPALASAAVEPVLGVLADAGRRRPLIVAGGVAVAGAWLLVAAADGFWFLLAALALASPASGAFVSLSQAALMDLAPRARERNMAVWTLAGSVGVVVGPVAVGAAAAAGLGWRGLFAGLALAALPLALAARRLPAQEVSHPVRASLRRTLAALRRREVVRWLVVLELADLMGDGLTGFLALYLVSTGSSPAQAAFGVAVWTGGGLVGDALLLLVLRRASGLAWLRVSAVAVAACYPAFLLAPGFAAREACLAALGVLTAGWYAVPQARLYEALPGQSGSAMALGTVSGTAAAAIPVAIGFLAGAVGLGAALWLSLAAPLALLVGARLRS